MLLDREYPTYAVVLRSGGDYDSSYARRLYRAVYNNTTFDFRFVCLTDMEVTLDEVYGEGWADYSAAKGRFISMSLDHDWPGWWSMIELFRLTGPVVTTGLDTVIVGNIDKLFRMALDCKQNSFRMFRPFSKEEKWASGFMAWNGDWRWLYKGFDPYRDIDYFKLEQRYTAYQLERSDIEVQAVQDHCEGLYSYKLDIRGNPWPENAKAILFHGLPRPRDVHEPFVEKNWRSL